MNNLGISPSQQARNAVKALESAADREKRSQARYSLPRLALGIGAALGLALVAPLYWLGLYFNERSKDKERAEPGGRAGASTPEARGEGAHGTAGVIDSHLVPLCVMPLADFGRLGSPVLKGAGKRFVLLAPVVYEAKDTWPAGTTTDKAFEKVLAVPGHEHLRQVPNSFITDFASIPWFLQPFLSPADAYARAAVFHDWAYAYHHDGSHRGRKDCDRAMLNLMRRDGVSPAGRSLIYAALRILGGWAFRTAPLRREAARPYAEALVFHFVAVQVFMLTYLCRQVEDGGLLDSLEARARRTGLSSGRWSQDIVDSLSERLGVLLGDASH